MSLTRPRRSDRTAASFRIVKQIFKGRLHSPRTPKRAPPPDTDPNFIVTVGDVIEALSFDIPDLEPDEGPSLLCEEELEPPVLAAPAASFGWCHSAELTGVRALSSEIISL